MRPLRRERERLGPGMSDMSRRTVRFHGETHESAAAGKGTS